MVAVTMGMLVGIHRSELGSWLEATSPRNIVPTYADRIELYVDCGTGSDFSGDGSALRPWRTPLRARDAVRALQPLKVPCDILIRGDCLPRGQDGALDFAQPLLELEAQDSGTASTPISYRLGMRHTVSSAS